MATTATYRFLYDLYAGLDSYAIATASGINTGDMGQWDTGSRIATNAALASGSLFLGVFEETNPLAGLGTTSNPLTGGRLRIKSDGVHQFKTTTSETYAMWDPVYQGADVQTVTKVGSTRMIGRVWLPDGTTVTGGSTTQVQVLLTGTLANGGSVAITSGTF